MIYINIETRTLRSPEYVGSDPVQRATWLSLLGYCCEQENGGRIVDARLWKDRRWQQTAGVTLEEVQDSCDLWWWNGDDLVLWSGSEIYASSANESAKWERRQHPKRRAAKRRYRRMAKARELGTHSEMEWIALLKSVDFKCVCCGATGVPLHRDHVVPVSGGGSDLIMNIQPLCKPCNSAKGVEIIDYRRAQK